SILCCSVRAEELLLSLNAATARAQVARKTRIRRGLTDHLPPIIALDDKQGQADARPAGNTKDTPVRACPQRGGLLGSKCEFVDVNGVRRNGFVPINLVIDGYAVPAGI